MTKILLWILVVFLQSCIGQRAFLKDESSTQITIPYKVTEVTFEDRRSNKRPMNWTLPMVATKVITASGHPEITHEQKILLSTLIKGTGNPNGPAAKVTVRLIEGVCQLYADRLQAKEYTKAVVEIEVQEIASTKAITKASEKTYNYGTMNALEKSVMKAYALALRNATHLALSQFAE